MKDYTVYCTQEQTRKAISLGAQPKIIDSQERVDKNIERIKDTYGIHSYEYKNATYYLVELRYKNSPRVVVVDKVVYRLPTAEQMVGWFFYKGIKDILISRKMNPNTFGFNILYGTNGVIQEKKQYPSHKEATLAAIDAALEYLANN